MIKTEHRWCVEDLNSGVPVAQGSAPTFEDAKREAGHYAIQYAKDGPVRYWIRAGRSTLLNLRMDLSAARPAAASQEPK